MARYNKNYLCVCHGKQEQLYLNHLAKLLTHFPHKIVKFNTSIESPYHLEKRCRYVEYDSVAIFDYDNNDVEFRRNIEICDSLNKKLRPGKRKSGQNIYHAYSNINFDLWLILHKEDFNSCVTRNDAYIDDVRRMYNLNYNDDIKNERIIDKILNQITLDDVKSAINRADNIRKNKIRTDAKKYCNTYVYSNPDFSIHEFLKIVLKDSGYL